MSPVINDPSLMMDLRERMVRIETKLDYHTSIAEDVRTEQDLQARRISAVELDQGRARTLVTTVAGGGGLLAAVATVWATLLHATH